MQGVDPAALLRRQLVAEQRRGARLALSRPQCSSGIEKRRPVVQVFLRTPEVIEAATVIIRIRERAKRFAAVDELPGGLARLECHQRVNCTDELMEPPARLPVFQALDELSEANPCSVVIRRCKQPENLRANCGRLTE